MALGGRDLGRRRDTPMPSPGRQGQTMRSPGTIDDRARDVAPDGVPLNFYNRGRIDPSPMPNPFPNPRMPYEVPKGLGPRGPMMPAAPDDNPYYMDPFPFGIGPNRPRDREFEYFRTPREIMPGDNPFPGLEGFMGQGRTMMPIADPRSQLDRLQNPNAARQNFMQMSSSKVDPSDYRTILKLIEQGLDPEDYTASSGIMSVLPQETQMAELTQGQKDFIRSQGGDQFQSRESLMNKIMTPQGGFDRGPFLGIFGGGQEPPTRQELDDFLNSGMVG